MEVRPESSPCRTAQPAPLTLGLVKMKLVRAVCVATSMHLGAAVVPRSKAKPEPMHFSWHTLRDQPLAALPMLPWQRPGALNFALTGGPINMAMVRPVMPVLRHVAKVKPCVPVNTILGLDTNAELMQPAKFRKIGVEQDDNIKRRRILKLWFSTLRSSFPEHTMVADMSSAPDPLCSLHHSMYDKSTSTLTMRLSGFGILTRWIQKHTQCDSLEEDSVYKFACAWHKHPTTVSSGIAASNFLAGILRDKSLLEVAASSRVQGASKEKIATMPAMGKREHYHQSR